MDEEEVGTWGMLAAASAVEPGTEAGARGVAAADWRTAGPGVAAQRAAWPRSGVVRNSMAGAGRGRGGGGGEGEGRDSGGGNGGRGGIGRTRVNERGRRIWEKGSWPCVWGAGVGERLVVEVLVGMRGAGLRRGGSAAASGGGKGREAAERGV